MAIALFPAAVGPQMTATTSAPPEPPLKLFPGQLYDGRATVHVVRRQGRIAQSDEQRAHLARRELVARLDRRLARDRRRESLVPAHRGPRAVAGQGRERVAKTAFGVETRMRHRHRAHEQRITAESLDLEPKSAKQILLRLERLRLRRRQVQRHWKE